MSLDTLDVSSIEAVLFDVGGVFFIPNHLVLRPLLADLSVAAPDDESFHRAHYVGIRHWEDELEDDAFWTGYNSRYVESLGIDVVDRTRVGEAIHGVWLSGMRLWTWVQDDAVRALGADGGVVSPGAEQAAVEAISVVVADVLPAASTADTPRMYVVRFDGGRCVQAESQDFQLRARSDESTRRAVRVRR